MRTALETNALLNSRLVNFKIPMKYIVLVKYINKINTKNKIPGRM